MTRIAAITTARNDAVFIKKWLDYYGQELGSKNTFLILDGHDQPKPPNLGDANLIQLPHIPLERVPAMRRRARIMSKIASGLRAYFDIIIATDVDEFLVLDPKIDQSLAQYLSEIHGRSSVSGLGLDVGQKMDVEGPIDLSKAFLGQRKYAHLSARYTKPSTTYKDVIWGSGMHRIKGHNFHIDPNLYHFHFGMIDYELATGKTLDPDRIATNWGNHLERREALFKIMTNSTPIPGDEFFDQARSYQMRHRPLYALNKPKMMPNDPVIQIPERFFGLV